MRILEICTVNFNYNGISSMIKNLGKSLKNNYSVDLLCFNYKNNCEEIFNNVYVAPNRKKSLIRYYIFVKKILKSENYDFVHIHGNSATMYLETLIIKKVSKAKIIVHNHNTKCTHKFLNKILSDKFNNSYDFAFACSKDSGKWLFKKDFSVMKNFIDSKTFSFNLIYRNELRKKYKISDKCKVIGHIGEFNIQKNQESILQMALNSNDLFLFLLIGSGPLKNGIVSKIMELHLEKKFILIDSCDDVYKYYNMMDLFVLPSLFEGFPVVLIEAQANGLSCIVSNCIDPEVNFCGNVIFKDNNKTDSWINDSILIDLTSRSENSNSTIQYLINHNYDINSNMLKKFLESEK